MTEWIREHCSERPDELQLIAAGLYIQRQNIEEVEHPPDEIAGTDAYTDYECDCREITTSEYQMLQAIQEIDSGKAIDEYTMQLIEQGVL